MVRKKVSEASRELMLKLYKKGLGTNSYPKIAKELGISVSSAWNHSKHLKINHVNQYR